MASTSLSPSLQKRSASCPPSLNSAPPREPLVSRFITTPLTFLSFLLSLFLIDQLNTTSRLRSHTPSPSPTSRTFSSRVRTFIYPDIAQPYEYVRAPTGPTRVDTGKEGGALKGREESWHWHTKQRKMLRLEVGQAFEVRKRVLVALVVCAVVACGMALWVVRWILVCVGGLLGGLW